MLHPARTGLLSAALITTLAFTGCGAEAQSDQQSHSQQQAESEADSLTVADPWVRATTDTEMPEMSAAFMALDNDGDETVTIVSASSPVTDMVELHETAVIDGKSAMQAIDGGIALEPGRGQLLQPGGMHVMLMGLDTELAPGDEVEITLELSDGSTVEITAPVKEFTEEAEHYHAPGTDENHSH